MSRRDYAYVVFYFGALTSLGILTWINVQQESVVSLVVSVFALYWMVATPFYGWLAERGMSR